MSIGVTRPEGVIGDNISRSPPVPAPGTVIGPDEMSANVASQTE